MNFIDFNFESDLLTGLEAMGFDKPTPIQEKAIPLLMQGKDLIACAQTGTGKTAAFILPILNKIAKDQVEGLSTLILAPTRELALQIDQQIQGFAYFLGISSIPVYGGGDGIVWEQQKKALEFGVEIVVATPGRLIALMAGGKLDFSSLNFLVLDEADRMLDMGFADDIQKIVNQLPNHRQTVLFSATMPPKIRQFARQLLKEPEEVSIAIGKTAAGVTQLAYMVYETQKEALIRHVLTQKDYEAVIIFASTKEKVKNLYKLLKKDFAVEAFHSDLEQAEREEVMSRFKNKSLKMLIGTDIISRGIDVVGISLVVNYDTPADPEDYVHRVGRTARADATGEAITFISDKDQRKFARIESLIGMEVEKLPLPEKIGEGPSYHPKTDKKHQNENRKGAKPFDKKKKKFSGKKHHEPSASTPKQEIKKESLQVQRPSKFGKRSNVTDNPDAKKGIE